MVLPVAPVIINMLLAGGGWTQPGFAIGMAVNTWYAPNGTSVGLDYAAAAKAGFTVVLNGRCADRPLPPTTHRPPPRRSAVA